MEQKKPKEDSNVDLTSSGKRPYSAPDLVDFMQEATVYFDTKDPGRGTRRPTAPSR